MYEDNFNFVLSFQELPEELVEEKIDRALTRRYERDEEQFKAEGWTLQEYLQDEDELEMEEQHIARHFPIYF